MPKYLIQASYSSEGLKGLAKDGGTKRRTVIQQALESVGAKLESLYYMFGEDDIILIVDAPNHAAVAAIAITSGAAGVSTNLKTSALLTPEEVDQAVQKTVIYTAAGQ